MAPRKSDNRKVCKFCATKAEDIDYKNIRILRRYINLSGKIQPRRYSGVCPGHQRLLATAIKRARVAALIPFVSSPEL
ncbi:MAG: 30S ribosomal protein S18 [Candidatus Gracilibacteria bacterium]|nr:30S ribosomal protein S18 [Candidatus Gracilibacteria bacterium]MDD5179313.1 30S ribosomal protein S18 [Candidatus Gracilibacteria bacterium]